jgi:hypothetical protein
MDPVHTTRTTAPGPHAPTIPSSSSALAEADLRLVGTSALGVLDPDDPRLAALRRACVLLESLEAERHRLDQRLLAGNRRDPMRVVTGRTSLDEAVDETRALIRELDDMLCEAAEAIRLSARTHPKETK